MTHKRFFQIFDVIVLVISLILSLMVFNTAFEKSFYKLANQPVGESNVQEIETDLDNK